VAGVPTESALTVSFAGNEYGRLDEFVAVRDRRPGKVFMVWDLRPRRVPSVTQLLARGSKRLERGQVGVVAATYPSHTLI